jgi:AbiTii-like protein
MEKRAMSGNYALLLRQTQDWPLSKSLSSVLRVALRAGDTELTAWVRLELLGYSSGNPAMTKETMVPEYRTVGGQWFDEYGRPLVITDSRLAFINETRLRFGVPELETFIGTSGTIALRLPEFSEIIRERLSVEVSLFRFSPHSIAQVLANIKAQLLDRLAAQRSELDKAPLEGTEPGWEDIVELHPNLGGIGLNLNALWKRWRSRSGGDQ